MIETNDRNFELTNHQRMYFGLSKVQDDWDRLRLDAKVVAYFDKSRIVKILCYLHGGYIEYDASIETLNREVLLPKTRRGRQQKLTVPRLTKIKGSGVQFSSTYTGGVHVYDNRRNLFFIRSFPEEGAMRNFDDISAWIANYIASVPSGYFEWLSDQLGAKRIQAKIEAGDFFAFRVSRTEYGFARVLSNVFEESKGKILEMVRLYGYHPRSLIVVPYAFLGDTLQVSIDALRQMPALPAVCMFDMAVHVGEMPIIGHRPLSEEEKQISLPTRGVTGSSLNLTKTDLTEWISRSKSHSDPGNI